MNLGKQFRQQIAKSFNLNELEQLAFGLGVDWDELDDRTKTNKIQSLVTHCQRRQQLPQLIAHLRQERRDVAWPDAAELAAALTTATPSDPQGRNRQNILNNIHTTWIEGVLEPSLHNDVALSLGLSYQHDVLNRTNRSLYPEEQPIPPDTSLGEIFTARGRSLLILGEPASGKTIALLQLLQGLLTVAQADPAEPIPIVLNLSSWARERAALTDWIVEELLVQYQAPRQLSRDWLAGNQLTLLLDGLDEVATEQREACVDAINAFKADQPADMVVCSRLADYQQLQARLNLSAAIRLQPLTPSQIDTYLASFGAPLAALRQAIATDDEWRELAQSPLMLNLMAFTYSEAPLPEGATLADKRRQMLAAYVQRTRQNRPLPPNSPYEETSALHWLHNIAAQLQTHDQSIFYIELLQPTWLPDPYYFRWLSRLVFRLFGVLLGGLIFGLSSGFRGELVVGLISILLGGLIGGLISELSVVDKPAIELVEEVRWLRRNLSQPLRQKVKVVLIFGLIFGLSIEVILGLTAGLIGGLVFGLIVGLVVELELSIQINKTRQRTQPNQGIWASWHNARWTGLMYGLIFGLVFGLIFELSNRLIFSPGDGLNSVLTFGLGGGLIFGPLQFGGQAMVKHYVLRWLLARQGVLPFPFQDRKLVAYLDEMAARLLLRRVGGGWIFIHRTLLEFLADEAEFQKLINDL